MPLTRGSSKAKLNVTSEFTAILAGPRLSFVSHRVLRIFLGNRVSHRISDHRSFVLNAPVYITVAIIIRAYTSLNQHSSAPPHIDILRASSGLCSGRPNPAHSSVDGHHNYSRSSCGYVSYYGIYILRYHCCGRLHHPPRLCDTVSSISFSFHYPTSSVIWPLLWHPD